MIHREFDKVISNDEIAKGIYKATLFSSCIPKNSKPVQKNTQNRSIRSRTEVYTKTQSKELRKLAIIGSTNILVIVIISFLI